MMRLTCLLAAGICLAAATPALAQDETAPPPPVTIDGTAQLVSDYRFRGISRSDENLAVQGGVTVSHQSGLYAGVWGSSVDGWGGVGGADVELDLAAGYRFKPSDTATLDLGVTYYAFLGGGGETDYVEPYAKLSGTIGPASLIAGVAYAPAQQALGRWYVDGAAAATGIPDDRGDKEDNLYLWGDATAGIPTTPLTARAHIGYSDGNRGLGPNATSLAPTGAYWDWLLGVDATFRNFTLGLAYVDTDISRRESAYLRPSFSRGQDGTGSIADGTVVVSLTAAF